jgi:hypothetical protein
MELLLQKTRKCLLSNFRPQNPIRLTISLDRVHSIEDRQKTRKTPFAQGLRRGFLRAATARDRKIEDRKKARFGTSTGENEKSRAHQGDYFSCQQSVWASEAPFCALRELLFKSGSFSNRSTSP